MKKSNFKLFLACAMCVSLWAGEITAQADAYLSEADLYEAEIDEVPRIADPLEPINRVTFQVNDFVYLSLLQPIAEGYQRVAPEPVRQGADNFFHNLRYPIRLAGNLLQGRVNGAWVETGRFAINTTVGIGGIFTPADRIEGFAPIPDEEVGQALGSWGIGEGPYLVIPLLGPSTVRDAVGLIGDAAAHPLREPFSLIDDWNWEWRTGIGASEILVESPQLIRRYKQMKGSAIDPYSALKNAYVQNRRAVIAE